MIKRIILITFFLQFTGCNQEGGEADKPVSVDLQDILKRGKLIALTGYSATSYFIYRGQPMGYEYELLSMLTKHLDLELEIKITKDIDRDITIKNL